LTVDQRYCIVVEVVYRRDDGTKGSFRVAEEGLGLALTQSTQQPLPPEGLYDEIQTRWKEGDRIAKPAGSYYPVRRG